MKIGNSIIQKRNITISTDKEFSATYKHHYINVKLYRKRKGDIPEWDIDVRDFGGGIAAETIVQELNIYDAIKFALDGSLLSNSCKCINNSWNRDAGCFVCDDCGKRI